MVVGGGNLVMSVCHIQDIRSGKAGGTWVGRHTYIGRGLGGWLNWC